MSTTKGAPSSRRWRRSLVLPPVANSFSSSSSLSITGGSEFTRLISSFSLLRLRISSSLLLTSSPSLLPTSSFSSPHQMESETIGGRRGASFCFPFLFGLEVIGPNIFTTFFHGSRAANPCQQLIYCNMWQRRSSAKVGWALGMVGGVSPAPVSGGLSAVWCAPVRQRQPTKTQTFSPPLINDHLWLAFAVMLAGVILELEMGRDMKVAKCNLGDSRRETDSRVWFPPGRLYRLYYQISWAPSAPSQSNWWSFSASQSC